MQNVINENTGVKIIVYCDTHIYHNATYAKLFFSVSVKINEGFTVRQNCRKIGLLYLILKSTFNPYMLNGAFLQQNSRLLSFVSEI